ncbi:MAG: C1 family peptidase [Desulfosporosinus sp.]|nr:C1 family peptidase [Desulfosporosinus sp.]
MTPVGHCKFFSAVAKLPPSVDLRDPFMPSIWNQGSLGSCTSFAACAAFEYACRKQHTTDFTPSQLFLYYNERMMDGDVYEDAGSTLSTGVRALREYGVCPLENWPYDISKFTVKPSQPAYDVATKHEVLGVSQVHATVLSIKGALAKGYPVILGLDIYSSFESDNVTKTGMIPEPHKHSEELLGGHAICLVGYDDEKKTFILRNSWGDDWGVKGYGFLPYAYIEKDHLASDPWIITCVE